MALPDPRSNHEDFVQSLRYFKAALGADPRMSELTPRLIAALGEVKRAHAARGEAEEAEMDARAVRDFINRRGDARIQDFRRELAGVAMAKHPTLEDVFPNGVKYVIAPAGEEQVRRLEELLRDLELARQSPKLETDPRKEKILRVLGEGQAVATDYLAELSGAVAAWKSAADAAALASEAALQSRQAAYAEAGAVLGRVRELCGGSEAAALAYTLPGPSRRKSAEEANQNTAGA